METKKAAALLLFFLSPLITELLSSSAPPSEFFSLGGILILMLYGPGVVIVREAAVRKRIGTIGVVLLGAAYGVLEEGVACKSFFDPEWPDLGIYSWYGRFLGVNWPWMLELIVYHAVFSIVVPILLTEALFHNVRSEAWVSSRSLKLLGLLLILDVVVINAVTPYSPSVLQYALALLMIVLLTVAAFRIRRKLKDVERLLTSSPRRMWLLTFLWSLTFIAIYWFIPNVQPYPQVVMGLGILHFLFLLKLLSRYSWRTMPPHCIYALASGPVTLLVALTPIHELSAATRPDNPQGMLIVGAASTLLLIWGYMKTKKHSTPKKMNSVLTKI